VFKRIVVVLTAVALVVGVLALPALAQEEGSEEETPSCAKLIENIQRYLTEYEAGRITAEELAAGVAAEVENAVADGVVCSEDELLELTSFIELILRVGDVAEILAAQYAPLLEVASLIEQTPRLGDVAEILSAQYTPTKEAV
jgi:hypothetical protein